jgi:hypothetical protein
VSDSYFILLGNPDKPTDLGIRVLLKNYVVYKNNPKLKEAVYIVIQHLLGEKTFANELKFIDIDQLHQIDDDYVKLHHLNLYINNED